MSRYIVKPIVTAISPIEYKREYGVFEYVENSPIHCKDEYAGLVILCHSELIAEKIRELLEIDDFIRNSESDI